MDTATHPDVFISYSRGDHAAASRFAQWCVERGWTVWWDEAITPGRKWDQAIEHALAQARCVLVLWSAQSVQSDWVKTEAAEAARRGVLVPVLIEPVALPLEFRRVQTLDLSPGNARPGGPAWDRLGSALAEHIGRPVAAPALVVVPVVPAARWRGWAAAAVALVGVLGGGALWRVWPGAAPLATPTAAPSSPEAAAPQPLPALASVRPPSAAFGGDAGASQSRLASAPVLSAHPGLTAPPALPRAAPRPTTQTSPTAAPTAAPTAGPTAAPQPLDQAAVQPTVPTLLTGPDVVRLADEQRLALLDKADKSGLFWTEMLAQKGGAPMLEQALLLALEAVGRQGGAAADKALRQALALMARPLRSLAHDDAVSTVAFSPDGRQAATASQDWTAALWDVASGRKTATLKHQDSVSDIVFSRDGRWVATASSDKTARLWQVADGKELARLPHPDPVQSLFFGADGRLLVTLSRRDDKLLLRLWSLPEGRETRLIEPPRQMLDFVLSDSGRYLVGRMPAGQIAPALVWDLSSGEQVASLSAGNGVIHSMATHGDVLALAEWGSSRAMVSLWRLGSWAPLGQVQGLRGSTVLALSADAGLLVLAESGANHGQILAAPVVAGLSRAKVLGVRQNGGACCLALSADGHHAVVSTMDRLASVIDLRSGDEVLRARLPASGSLQAALSPDGRRLLTNGAAGANLWEVNADDPVRSGCARVKRNFSTEEWRRWFGDEPWRKTCAS